MLAVRRHDDGSPWYREAPHTGVDFRPDWPRGPVLAAAPGRVVDVRFSEMYGWIVTVMHLDHFSFTRYAHLDRVDVEEGDRVAGGEPIGAVGLFAGSGGIPHVHLELVREVDDGDCPVRPVDPMPYMVGCPRPETSYDGPRLVLTYPVRC